MNGESVSEWIGGLQAGDESAVERLWARYFRRLSEVAAHRLPRGVRRDFDEEDVALSAFHSLCRGARAGRFPLLRDRDNLWALLVVISSRKARRAMRDRLRLKRGGGQVMGESVLGSHRGAAGELAAFLSEEPSADFATQLAEESARRIDSLPDPDLRAIAHDKLEGLSNEEIADRLGCAVRTVERRLRLIRQLWSVDTEAPE